MAASFLGADDLIKQARKVKPNYAFPQKLKNMFETLEQIEIADEDFSLPLETLKPEHGVVISEIFQQIKSNNEGTTINKFTEWKNQYLAQLLHGSAKSNIEVLMEYLTDFKENPRFNGVLNEVNTLLNSFQYFTNNAIVRLLSAEESSNSYPISKEGATFISEFATLQQKMKLIKQKIKQFVRSQK
jgi:hypothetical protein